MRVIKQLSPNGNNFYLDQDYLVVMQKQRTFED